MKLKLYDEDLKPEHRGVDAGNVNIDMFLPEVQDAILYLGSASFGNKMILPSKEQQETYNRVRQARRAEQEMKHGGRSRPSGVPYGH